MKPYTWQTAILKSDLAPTTRHVLLTLGCHLNVAGEACFPSTLLLAEETGLSERAVVTHLRSAAKLGWVSVRSHGLGGQKWRRHEYCPLIPKKSVDVLNDIQHLGTEPGSAPSEKALNVVPKGTEPNDKKALNEVQSNSPYNYPRNCPINTARTLSRAECMREVRARYPKREGSQRWADAARALNARLDEGDSAQTILDGVNRYAAYSDTTGIRGSPMVQQAATFLGRNRGYLEDWKVNNHAAKRRNRNESTVERGERARRQWAAERGIPYA